jgi:hypothetical protein
VGNGDPAWDIVYFIHRGPLTTPQIDYLLNSYGNSSNNDPTFLLRLSIYEPVIWFKIVLWLRLQQINKNFVLPEAQLKQLEIQRLQSTEAVLKKSKFRGVLKPFSNL